MKTFHITDYGAKICDRLQTSAIQSAIDDCFLAGAIYAVILLGYAFTVGVFDYDQLVHSLTSDQKVKEESFFVVAAYISFGNSFLEEVLFRGFAFLQLSDWIGWKWASLFSALLFSLYHVAMLAGSFPLPLLLICVAGLAVGGAIFNWVDQKERSLFPSWGIHAAADLALMTVWCLHL